MKLFWSPQALVLHLYVKPARSHLVTWQNGERVSELDLSTCYKQALASVLQLTSWTIPVPYLINTQSTATYLLLCRYTQHCLACLGPAMLGT